MFGQTVSSYVEYGLTHSSVLKGATLDSAACTVVRWGTSTGNYTTRTMHVGSTTTPGWQLSGLPSNTQIFWRIYNTGCTSTEVGDTALDTEQTFTTAAAVTHPVYATLPTDNGIAVDGYSSLTFTNTYDVPAGDCNNVSTGLAARLTTAKAQNVNQNHRIRIPAGTTCTGTYTLPAKDGGAGTGYIVITTDSTLMPPAGVRVGLTDVSFMPTIAVNNTASSSFPPNASASKYWLRGLFIAQASASADQGSLVDISGGATDIVIDQCVIVGAAFPGKTNRAVSLGSINKAAVINSYISANKAAVSAGIPVGIYNATNIKVENNYLEGHGPALVYLSESGTGLMAADIIIRRNTLNMPEIWKLGSATSDGNRYLLRQVGLEIKRGNRVLYEGNRIHGWADEQITGQAILLMAARNAVETDCPVCDITIRYNYFEKVTGGVQIASFAGGNPEERVQINKRISIYGNVWGDYDPTYTCASPCNTETRGYLLRVDAVEDLVFENNTVHEITATTSGTIAALINPHDCCAEGLVYRDNIIWADNSFGPGTNLKPIRYGSQDTQLTSPDGSTDLTASGVTPKDRLDAWAIPSYTFLNNSIVAGSGITTATMDDAGYFPANQFFPGDQATGLAAVKFNGASTSTLVRSHILNLFTTPYKASSTSGAQLGANPSTVYTSTGGSYNAVVQSVGTTTATVGYYAPADSGSAKQVCASSDSFATQICATATVHSTIPWYQTAALSGLTTGTTYTYRIYSSGAIGTGTFKTR